MSETNVQPNSTAPHIFLVGLSGSGKSTIGRLLSERLGVAYLDTDAEIERITGHTIPELFELAGEGIFRAIESDRIAEICRSTGAVVATGGGAAMDERNREQMHAAGAIIWLDAPIPVLVERLQALERPGRPLLAGDPAAALARLDAQRRSTYAAIGHQIDASGTPQQTVERILVRLANLPTTSTADDPIWVDAPSQTYPVYVAPGLLERAGQLLNTHGLTNRLHVVVDERVDRLHGDRLRRGLEGSSYTWHVTPAGEEHKTQETVSSLYDSLLAEGPERRDVIIAFGGGVIGDLVGFVSATLLRGMRFVQIPTTVLSQVDSSVGGKTGYDHARGKNLIGAFHQPSLVLADLDVLQTLPPREIAAGWAEVVKIAVVQDADLFKDLEASAGALKGLERGATQRAIRRSIELKARLVERDERDTTGIRAILNYGHTVGHALEAATGYETLLHGEGVAIGMAAAAHIAEAVGIHPPDAVARQARLLDELGLPSKCEAADRADVIAAIGLDKKREGSRTTWILPAGLGEVRVTSDVPERVVDEALDLVLGKKSSDRTTSSSPAPSRA